MTTGLLSQPLTLPCGVTLKNRIAKAAMTEGLADVDGKPNDKHVRLYETWAKGGAALLITGNVMVDKRYLERPGNVVIDDNEPELKLAKWAKHGTINDTQLWMQISHPGRQCTRWVNAKPVAPSATQLKLLSMFNEPRALTLEEIHNIQDAYARVALSAKNTGFSGVQIHGAHGYLISQFLSPIVNQRQDEYGGSLENRARFLLETIDKVRQAVGPQFPVALKLNSADFQKGGFDLEQCTQVVEWLNDTSLDLIELSGGTYEQPQLLGHHGDIDSAAQPQRESTKLREAYFVKYAIEVRKVCQKPLMVTGGFESLEAMNEALRHVDMIGVGRPFCVLPDWPNQLLEGEIDKLPRVEKELPGTGFWGPTSSSTLIQGINIQGEVAWFYYQILRLGDGLPPTRKIGLFKAFLLHNLREQKLARARNKYLKT